MVRRMIYLKQNTKNKIFDAIMVIICVLAIVICLVPFLNIIAISLSSNAAVLGQRVTIFPIGFNIKAYYNIITDRTMISSFFFTVKMTFIYTALSMIMTILAAYPLSKKRLKGRNVFLLIIVITMYFSGGLIPNYLLVKGLHLRNTIWALIMPGMLSTFNLIILKSFFTSSIPDSLEESAYLDGCSDFRLLVSIILPLSTPVLATLALFYAVGRWNGFMDALLYIDKAKLYPLQLKLYQLVFSNMATDIQEGTQIKTVTPEGLKAASVIFTTVPILIVYPWIQRYFVSGVMIGAVKG